MDRQTTTAGELLAFLDSPHGQQCRRFWVKAEGGVTSVPLPRKAFAVWLAGEWHAGKCFAWTTGHYPGVGWTVEVERVTEGEG